LGVVDDPTNVLWVDDPAPRAWKVLGETAVELTSTATKIIALVI